MMTVDNATVIAAGHSTADLRDDEFPLGSRLGDFDVGAMLGAGSVGSVYEARNRQTGEVVAIKVLHADGAQRCDRALRAFARDAQVVAFSGCRQVVEVRDVGRLRDGRPFFVMEKLAGVGLRRLIGGRGGLPPGKALVVIKGVAQALRAAHRLGVVHGDVRPSNVFVADRGKRIVLLDLGIRRLRVRPRHNPRWPVPRDPVITIGTDIHGLGALAHFVLTGAPPPPDEEPADFEEAAPAGECEELHPLSFRVIQKAMEDDPSERYQTPAAFLASLRRALKSETSRSMPGAARREADTAVTTAPSAAIVHPVAEPVIPRRPEPRQRMFAVHLAAVGGGEPAPRLMADTLLDAAIRTFRAAGLCLARHERGAVLMATAISGEAVRDDHRCKELIRAAKAVVDRTRSITCELAIQVTIAERKGWWQDGELRGAAADLPAWVASPEDGEGVYLAPDLLARLQAKLTVQ